MDGIACFVVCLMRFCRCLMLFLFGFGFDVIGLMFGGWDRIFDVGENVVLGI